MANPADLILEDNVWAIVYGFFHPEINARVSLRGHQQQDEGGLSSLFEGVLSRASGVDKRFPKSEARIDVAWLDEIYAGIPASLTWEAYGICDAKLYWRAEIDIASGMAMGDTVLVSVTNANGEGIDGAKLILLGTELQVSSGMAAYSLARFQERLENTEVALQFQDGSRVQGTLKFGAGNPSLGVRFDY